MREINRVCERERRYEREKESMKERKRVCEREVIKAFCEK